MRQPVSDTVFRPVGGRSEAKLSRIHSYALEAKWPITLSFALLVLVLWEIAAVRAGSDYVVGPWGIGHAFVADATQLIEASVSTLGRLVVGVVLGAGLGTILGLASGVVRSMRDLADPIVILTYPLPKVALFPGVAVILGYTDTSRILIIALAAFYPAYLNAFAGSRSVNRDLVSLARNAGAGRTRTFFSVIVPAALPKIITGLRISLAVSFVLAYVAEALGGSGSGLGFRIGLLSQTNNYAPLYAAIACFAGLGILGDRLLLWLGRRVTRGQELEMVGDAR